MSVRLGPGSAGTLAAVRLVTLDVLAPFPARLLAARLGAEGIVWQLRGGGTDSLYPFGPVELLVDEDDVEVARELLADATSDEVEWRSSGRRAQRRLWAIATLLLAVLAVATFGRIAAMAL
jgi:Putative prokaryotic signal transducing protein